MMESLTDCLTEELVVPAPTYVVQYSASYNGIDTVHAQARQAIAPAWPLDCATAVNPHWACIGMPVRRVATRMATLDGIQVFPGRDRQLQAQTEGCISVRDLDQVIRQMLQTQAYGLTVKDCVQALYNTQPVEQLPPLIDVLDNDPHRQVRLPWRQATTRQVSQTCAAHFDQTQAGWQSQWSESLCAFWRETLQYDHSIGLLMGLPYLAEVLEALPVTREDVECWVLHRPRLPKAVWSDYLESVLLTVNGWVSWCVYLGWQVHLNQTSDPHLRELLATRLV